MATRSHRMKMTRLRNLHKKFTKELELKKNELNIYEEYSQAYFKVSEEINSILELLRDIHNDIINALREE